MTFTVGDKADACDMPEGGKQLMLSLAIKSDRIDIGDIVIDGSGNRAWSTGR